MTTRMHDDDDALKALYRRLRDRRAAEGSEPAVALEQLRSLAEGQVPASERERLLDQVLAHPRTTAEFLALHDIARARAGRAAVGFRRPPWLAAAAAVALVLGAAAVLRLRRVPEPMRGDAAGVVLVHPAPGETLVPDHPLVWRAVPGALDYELVLADPDGNTIVRRVTGDTIAAVDLPPGVAALQWWVTVRLADGSTRRSGSRTLRAPAP